MSVAHALQWGHFLIAEICLAFRLLSNVTKINFNAIIKHNFDQVILLISNIRMS